jgi:hypothetical protein
MSSDISKKDSKTQAIHDDTVQLLLVEHKKAGDYQQAIEERLDNFATLYLTIATFTLGGALVLYQARGLDLIFLGVLISVLVGLLGIGLTFLRRIILVHVHRHRIALQVQILWGYFMSRDPEAMDYFKQTSPIPYFFGGPGGFTPLELIEAWNSSLIASAGVAILLGALFLTAHGPTLMLALFLLGAFVVIWLVSFRALRRYVRTLERRAQIWMRLVDPSAA